MSHIEGKQPGDLYWQAWLPEGDARAVVLLAHGLAEHGGRYWHVGAAMNKRGYALYAIDHRGHGRSPGKRTLIDSMDAVVSDLHGLGEKAAGDHPGAPVFLYGHSMGGAIAFSYALRYQSELAGLILSGPALVVEGASPAMIAVGKLVAKIAPGAGVMQLDGSGVSRDPEVVSRYDSDPLNYRGKAAAKTLAEIVQVATIAPARLGEIKLPVLVIGGTADRLVSPKAVDLVEARVGSADKTFKRYEGLYHEVHNEPEKEEVLKDVLDWLDARVQPTGVVEATETSAP